MLPVYDPEKPNRPGEAQGTYDVINGRAFGECGHLFIRAELSQHRKKPDRNVHK